MMGGKPDPKNSGKGAVIPLERLYTPDEELPWFAYFDDHQARAMNPATAQDLIANIKHLPLWALDLAPVDEARRVLSQLT